MSESDIFFIIYVSSAVELFSPPELLSLLEISQKNNAARDITGMLLYKDGEFMQALEGEEDAVRDLYTKIERDTRHRQTMLLLQGNQATRQFASWSMGFRDLNSSDALAVPGYSEFLNTPLTDETFFSSPTRAHQLLLAFKSGL